MAARNDEDLLVWQKSMDLVEWLYKATVDFPKEEIFGLRSQMRRAVIAIPSNIAEGQGRNSRREFPRFLSIAYGSLRELETQIQIAKRLRYLEAPDSQFLRTRCGEVGRLLNGLSNSLSRPFEK
jgi:four helix bundle protein